MTYTKDSEIIITTQEMRLYARLRAVMELQVLELFVLALEEVAAHGKGLVTVKVYRGVLRFIERTFTDDMRG